MSSIIDTNVDVNIDITSRMNMFDTYVARSNMDRNQYQYDGVKWCLMNELRPNPPCGVRGGFVADEMGLGKTITMIGTMVSHMMLKTLIVLPPILVNQWFLQIYKTTGHKPLIYHGANKKTITIRVLEKAPIVLTTYGAVTLTKKTLKAASDKLGPLHQVHWNRIVFDEAHHLRNKNTRFISCKLLKTHIRWLVTGTPIQNAKHDFYHLCNILGLPASYYTESSNLLELTNAFILKRTKKSVGISMPDLIDNKEIVQWKNNKEMMFSEQIHTALGFANSELHGTNNPVVDSSHFVLTLMIRAKQSCIYPKLLLNYITSLQKKGIVSGSLDGILEALKSTSKLDSVVECIYQRKDNGNRKIVFCHYREEINELCQRLSAFGLKIAKFDGSVSAKKREMALKDNNDVLILQIQTGCEGLNLQEYNEVYFVSPHWNPAVEDQAVARCHRIGQDKPVYIMRFEMNSFDKKDKNIQNEEKEGSPVSITMDQYVNEKQGLKRFIINEVMNP